MISTLVNAIKSTMEKQDETTGDAVSMEKRSKPVDPATMQAFQNTCAYLNMRKQDSMNTNVGRWKGLDL